MKRLETSVHAAISLVFILASFADEPTRLAAAPPNDISLADQSTPETRVRIYGFPGLGSYTMRGAEIEATRILRTTGIEVAWIDCFREAEAACTNALDTGTDLIVRILPKALPRANSRVLGLAVPASESPAAFIFFDRIATQRTHTRLVPVMLGRVIVHEITHLLLPDEGHSTSGLMKGQMTFDDFDLAGNTFLGLSRHAQVRLREEASRRLKTQSRMR